MTNQQCKQWIDLADRDAIGETISNEDRTFLREHVEVCSECRAESALWDDMRADPETDTQGLRPPTIDQLMASARPSLPPRRLRRRSTLIAGGFVAAAMAAAVLFIVFLGQPTTNENHAANIPRVTTGEWTETTDEPRCLDRSDEARVCLAPRSKARPFNTDGGREGYELARGTIAVDLPPRVPRRPFVITTPGGEVEAVGTVFAVQVTQSGRAVAQLLEGRLRIRAPGVDTVAITAGETLVVGDSGPESLEPRDAEPLRALLGLPEPTEGPASAELSLESTEPEPIETKRGASSRRQPATSSTEEPSTEISPPSLLQKARRFRLEGRHQEAAAAYRELQQRHPASAEARASLVSLGQLQLSHLGAPSAALRSFNGYLARRGGALDREALHGRISALRALGRSNDERQAIEGYLQRFPSGVRARSLRLRLDALQAPATSDR